MRRLVPVLSALLLAACMDGGRELREPVEPLGDFRLGHAVVTASNLQKGPASRDASQEEWIAAMDAALEERFRRYEGDQLYHLGVSVEGYVLARPGIPVVFNPNSVVIVRVNVLRDGVYETVSEARLHPEAKEITALEAPSAQTLVGSGVTQTKEEQLTALSRNAALQIETWLRRQARAEGWFGGLDIEPGAAAAPSDPEAATAPAGATTPPAAAPGPAPAGQAPAAAVAGG
ncbi:hypothetical protein ROJ8625_03672 [Roseivivax jejudonensis]|uniref:Lipopolysaccharide-assembly n=1 Tax=Roseivivax jejudonensis TaxID=1529041 RepID=A0A1X7A479_9RHOB|nr:hypothetical protein [Roseivivax jejudonensis]SLN70086.1 hypothetical protein ROJ8625_03672 [Roseivivax jejudonensis]